MIKKLRLRFILTSMISLAVVLAVIMSAVNIINYTSVTSDADKILTILSQNNGEFPKGAGWNSEWHLEGGKRSGLSSETPYKTRYFTVVVGAGGTIQRTNISSVSSVTEAQADEYAKQVLAGGSRSGYFANTYRYLVTGSGSSKMVIFADCQTQLNYVSSFLLASAAISLLGLVLVFVLVIIFSKRAVKPLAESYEKQKRFITDSSHELKTPLAVISADLEIVEMNSGESEWTQDMKEQIKYLSKLVRDLTALARMDESSAAVSRSEFDLSDAAADTLQQFKSLMSNSGKKFNVNIDDGIIYYGSEELIRRLVSVLADNAAKYGKSYVSVRVFKKKNRVHLEFENDTFDPVPEDASVLFERFYRTDESRAKESGGFGIGLSLAKSIAELHGGKISAQSGGKYKITFTVIL